MADPVTLRLRAVSIRRGPRTIIDGLTLTADPGELVAVIGASGAGKTSVLRAISGLDPIAAGEIEVGDVRLTPGAIPRGARLKALHRSVGMVFQFHHLFANMTAVRNVCLAPVHVLRQDPEDVERRARALLHELGVGDRADGMPHELSGGEAQRVAIARALAIDPPILLLDEPTASLDASRRQELAATLVHLTRQGRTIVVATHDGDFVRACASRTVSLDATKIAVGSDA